MRNSAQKGAVRAGAGALFFPRVRDRPTVALGRLTTAHQQIVEIAKALSYESKILIMDEPTASLSKNEIDRLFSLMKTLQDVSTLGIRDLQVEQSDSAAHA
jgi:ABC-type sugar transport system ATPase subunit